MDLPVLAVEIGFELVAAALAAVVLGVAFWNERTKRGAAAAALVEAERRAVKERERASIAERDLEAERVRMAPIAEGHQHLLATLSCGFQEIAGARDAAALMKAIAATGDRVFDPSQLMVFQAADRDGKEFTLAAIGGQRGSPWRVGGRLNEKMGRVGLVARRRTAMDRHQFDVEPPLVREQLDATEPEGFVVEVAAPVIVSGNVAAILSVGGSTLPLDATRSGLELLAAHAALQLRALEASARIDRLKNSDEMTGLGSKGWFVAEGSEAVFRCRTDGSPAALVVLGIDDFRGYVARTGHAAGDRLLKGVAEVLRAQRRDDLLIARWSGAEFVVLAPGASPREGHLIAERLRSAVSQAQWPGGAGQSRGRVTMSAGVAFLPSSGKDLDELIEVAASSLASARWRGDATYSAAADSLFGDDSPTQDAPTQDAPAQESATRGAVTQSLAPGHGPTQ